MTSFTADARKTNSNGTIEVTIPANIRRKEDIEDGDLVTLTVEDVEKA